MEYSWFDQIMEASEDS